VGVIASMKAATTKGAIRTFIFFIIESLLQGLATPRFGAQIWVLELNRNNQCEQYCIRCKMV
jgi:hypothetical protein